MNAKEVSEALGDVKETFIAEAMTYKRKKLPLWFPIAAVAACLCLLIGLMAPGIGHTDLSPTGMPTMAPYGQYFAYFSEGVPVEGLVIGGDSSNAVLQDLQITLNLTASPLENTRISDNTAVLDYTFHNPTGEPITLALTLPAGQDPRYASSYEYETGNNWFDTNRHLYTASANGQSLDLTLRMTGNDIPPVAEDQWSVGLFNSATPVTVFTYKITDLGGRADAIALVRTSGLGNSVTLLENGQYAVVIDTATKQDILVSLGQQITLCVFGDATGFQPVWAFYTDFTYQETLAGTAEPVSTQQMTIQEYAAGRFDTASGVCASDYALLLATQLHHNTTYNSSFVELSFPQARRWFQYELTLAPGETVVNTVTLPLYPDALITNMSKEAFICHIDLLSLRIAQPQTGPVITLNTPYELTESAVEYTATENSYTLDLTQYYKINLELKLGDSRVEIPPVEEPSDEAEKSVHWLTVLRITALTGLGLYWFLRRKTE